MKLKKKVIMELFKRKKREEEAGGDAPDTPDTFAEAQAGSKQPGTGEGCEERAEEADAEAGAEADAEAEEADAAAGADEAEAGEAEADEAGSEAEDCGPAGRLSREELERLVQLGLDYERAVAAAEVRGRNAAIEEHLRQREESDGVPHPQSGAAGSDLSRPRSIFDLAWSAR